MRAPAEARREMIFGVHPVLEALESGRRDVERVLVVREQAGHGIGRVLRAAREAGVPVTHLPREVLVRKAGARAVHQGVAAVVSPVAYADPDEICRHAAGSGETVLVVDGVEDPGNLGALVRSAAAAGVAGVLLGTEETAGITPVAAKASAGAVERVPIAREGHLRRRLLWLKERGFRVVALDARGATPWDRADLEGSLAIVVGGEGTGIRRGILQVADDRVAIPLARGVESLNVSVAAAVLLFEAVRRRWVAGRPLGSSVPALETRKGH